VPPHLIRSAHNVRSDVKYPHIC